METEVELREVSQQYLAAVREHTTSQNLATKIRELLTENAVYTFLNDAGIKEHSHNVFVFWDDDEGLVIEVAVQVFAPFVGDDRVICSSTPQGKAATLLHIGRLRAAWQDARGYHWLVSSKPPCDDGLALGSLWTMERRPRQAGNSRFIIF